ncbi:hypothetical protein PGT21_029253 [Puccinia graminis f. sp. tritici]|uniref:Uncharacterized protein n=1 Tax=Puccinia graminis f. sp. tritici TaxID=56615 RepID=A0A5B0NRX5_PUCGR|nr:hypothetical protein PGT21_029253 [Puccinia graminis f. sp. tritici]
MVAAGVMLGPTHEQNNGKKSQDFQVIVNDELQKVNSIKESQAEVECRVVDAYMGSYRSISRLGRGFTSLIITCHCQAWARSDLT